jgi:hypothetical protein
MSLLDSRFMNLHAGRAAKGPAVLALAIAATAFGCSGTPGESLGVSSGSELRFSGNPSVPGFSFLVFDSFASNLVFGDTNGFSDIFSASLSP